MERIELKTTVATRVLLGVFVAMPVIPLAMFGETLGGVVAGALVAGYIALCIAMSKRRLVVDERGVSAKGLRGIKRLEWDEIDHYTFWSMDQQGAYYAGTAGNPEALVAVALIAIFRALHRRRTNTNNRRFGQGRLTLLSAAGLKVPIDSRYKGVSSVLDRVFAEMHPRLRTRVGDTLPTDFAPFTLTDNDLTHAKKGSIGLADIEKIHAAGSRISIKKRGKRLAWAGSPMRSVKNSMLFLEIAAERGLVVNANAEVFMPPSVLDKLRAATARQSAMPQARVVAR